MNRTHRNGIIAMEIILFLIVIAIVAPMAIEMLNVSKNSMKVKITKTRIKALSQVIENVFVQNATYAQKNCYGWNDGVCSSLTLTPIIENATTLNFNTTDTLAVKALISVGCNVTGSAPNFHVQCYDGYGHLLKFSGLNLQTKGYDYTDPYQNKYPQIKVTATHGIPAIISIPQTINNAKVATMQKFNTIANAIQKYVRGIRIAELGNTCGTTNTSNNPSGGLSSTDNAIVPYVWESVASTPYALCSGIENTKSNCGCKSFGQNTYWEQSSSYCTLNTSTTINRILTNLNLGTRYKTDGFGNKIIIVPLSNANGQPINCPPARPHPNYTGLTAIPKTRVGVKNSSGQWVDYIDIISD